MAMSEVWPSSLPTAQRTRSIRTTAKRTEPVDTSLLTASQLVSATRIGPRKMASQP